MGRIREISVASFDWPSLGQALPLGGDQAFFVRYGLGVCGLSIVGTVLKRLVLEQCKRLGVGSYSEFSIGKGAV